MTSDSPEQRPLSPSERWVAGAILAIILGLFAVEIAVDYEPVKLTALLIVLFWVPLLVLHEAGHALMAALLGWHVARVVIGMGWVVGRFHVRGALVEVRLIPIEGFVQPVPTNLRAPHLKSALIYLAGPGIELVLVGLLVLLVGLDTMLSRTESLDMLALQSLAVAALVGVFINLVPHEGMSSSGPAANDGLGAIRSFLVPESHYAERIGYRYDEAEDAWRAGDSTDWRQESK